MSCLASVALVSFLSPDSSGCSNPSGDLGSCPSRAHYHGDSRGTTSNNGQNLTDRAAEDFTAHRPLGAGLCKAVLRSSVASDSIRDSYPAVKSGLCRMLNLLVGLGWVWWWALR